MLEDFNKFNIVGEFGVGEALDWGWRLFARLLEKIAALVLAIFVPFHILQLLSAPFLGVSLDNPLPPANLTWWHVFALLGLLLASGLLTLLVNMTLALMIKGEVDGEEASLWHYLTKAWSMMGKGIWASFIMGVILLLAFLFFIIPGIIYSVYYAFTIYIVVLLNMNAVEAISYSRSLVAGRWWRIFGLTLVLGLISWAVSAGAELALGWMGFVGRVINYTVVDLMGAFTTTVMVTIFLNMELQRQWSEQ